MEPIFNSPDEARKCKLENVQLKRKLLEVEIECQALKDQNRIMFNAIRESLESLQGDDLKPFSFIKGLVE